MTAEYYLVVVCECVCFFFRETLWEKAVCKKPKVYIIQVVHNRWLYYQYYYCLCTRLCSYNISHFSEGETL